MAACTTDAPDPAKMPPIPSSAPAFELVDDPTLSAMQPPEHEAKSVELVENPYAGWDTWCEPTWYETQCEAHEDCADIEHVARRPLRCVRPWWAEKDDLRDAKGNPLRVCAPGYAATLERKWRYFRLRELVAQLYFDEPEHCPPWTWERTNDHRRYVQAFENQKPLHHQHWRCQREWKKAERLTGFLWVPYRRETTARPWKRHRLNPDEAANRRAYVRQAHTYGWHIELECPNERLRCKTEDKVIASIAPFPGAKQRNPHYLDQHRWQYGLGGRGKNSALGVQDWDLMAPPEILCLEIPDTEAYLRDARHAVDVLRGSGVSCGERTYRGRATKLVDGDDGEKTEIEVAEPSWIDIHRVASGGKFCPRNTKTAAKFETNLRRGLERMGVRPDEPVTREMLGRPIPRDSQNEIAFETLAHLDRLLPPPWPDPWPDDDGKGGAPSAASSP